MASNRRVIAPHAPSLEGRLASVHTLDDYVLQVEELLDVLGLESVVVLGSSFGGWVAAELAALRPERIQALVLVDALGLYVPGEPAAEIFASSLPQLAGLLLKDRRALDVAALPTFDSSQDPMESMSRLIMGQEAMARLGWSPYLHNPGLPARLRRYRGPALVIWGSHDQVLSEGHAHRWCDLLGAELSIVQQAGHLPAIEQPAAVARLVDRWLGKIGIPGS